METTLEDMLEGLNILSRIQSELKVPKDRQIITPKSRYNFRNKDDIMEKLKEIKPPGVIITCTNQIRLIGERYYLVAIAKFQYRTYIEITESPAREPLTLGNMNEPQITGAATTYAEKNALCGLLLIHNSDAKDPDSCEDDVTSSPNNTADYKNPTAPTPIVSPYKLLCNKLTHMKITPSDVAPLLKQYGYGHIKELPENKYEEFLDKIQKTIVKRLNNELSR